MWEIDLGSWSCTSGGSWCWGCMRELELETWSHASVERTDAGAKPEL